MQKTSKIYVAGHQGLVGSALMRNLQSNGYSNIITRSFKQLDLRNQLAVETFFQKEKPDIVFLAAAKVGGIHANDTYKAEFIYDNLMIATNIIHASYKFGVQKLLNLGSSCIYPKLAPQPLKEEYILTSELEPTNEPYAIAKIAAIKLCRYYNEQYGTNFMSVMPTNLYGPHDNFDLDNAHVLPSLVAKFHIAKQLKKESITLWGTGKPYREFLYVDDLVKACMFLMKNYNASEIGEFINIGTGNDITIKDLAELIKTVIGFNGGIFFDISKPDGTPKKQLEVSRIHALGWKHIIKLEEGIQKVYDWYTANTKCVRLERSRMGTNVYESHQKNY
ncbi:MAG: GDP-L-fucose synthase family protein [Methanosarcinaceae archaeon]